MSIAPLTYTRSLRRCFVLLWHCLKRAPYIILGSGGLLWGGLLEPAHVSPYIISRLCCWSLPFSKSSSLFRVSILTCTVQERKIIQRGGRVRWNILRGFVEAVEFGKKIGRHCEIPRTGYGVLMEIFHYFSMYSERECVWLCLAQIHSGLLEVENIIVVRGLPDIDCRA
jgi:hypothetical protein